MAVHFYELLSNLGINPQVETKNLQYLFSEDPVVPMRGYGKPLEEYIDKYIFRYLKIRGTFINITDMRNALGIGTYQLNGSFETLFLFAEFLIALFIEAEGELSTNPTAEKQVRIIMDNIATFVNKSNHELFDTGGQHFIIIEKNKVASQAVEFIEDQEVAKEVIEYNHYKLKGNLQEKQKILSLLGTYIEPILKDRELNSKYQELFSDVSFLLNCFHIRHNNKIGKNAQEFIKTIDETVLEMWYDRAYNMILSVIISKQNFEFSKELSILKKAYVWKR